MPLDASFEAHELLANIVRLYRGEQPEFLNGSEALVKERFPELSYVDVAGLCKIATVAEIETHGWSLNPGRYVGVADGDDGGFDFAERFGELTEELQGLSIEAQELSDIVIANTSTILTDGLAPTP